ncbi:hypothetical protein NS220_17260 [Microbacterium testaceum]|uniref:Uncharacterized protein n=1 Tax=Microbacterium testaceum TaxID=2033 RepID=A0A147EST5_MICTE|nr:hypothetical protein [Microbacterium testaceum]KTR87685.1 hypothetical protein NS220_17260 [Microbacterium testaceum]
MTSTAPGAPAHDRNLAVELSRLAAAGAPTDRDEDPERLLAAVAAFQDITRVAADLQAQAARTAHDSGVSWARIGALLGVSRQAVQQRFDPNYVGTRAGAAEGRMLGPVTRAEELAHLEAAGAQGWKLVEARHGEHRLVHTGDAWDVQRVSILTPGPLPAAGDGWEAAATRFPDCFYVRSRSAR